MVSSAWDEGLTEEQVIAASHTGSHARLLAGPGTGKSHTLSRRILFLIKESQIKPSEILVLAFTRIAVRDLRKSISRQLHEHSDGLPYIATIHSFALRQLMRNALIIIDLPQPFRIADDWEERWIIYEDLKVLLTYDVDKVKDKFAELSADWETLQLNPDSGQPNRADPKFVGAWQQHRRTYGYTLRAELVYQLKRSLEQIPNFNLEPGFEHLLVDEYQDLNPCELSVVKAISERGPLVMACGDDDQSIYHFRYADPSGIRNFIDTFQNASDLNLAECRRCDQDILSVASAVAQQDINRLPKELHARRDASKGDVRILRFDNNTQEVDEIALCCRELVRLGVKPEQILILLRSNFRRAFSDPLVAKLQQLGLDCSVPSSKAGPLDERDGRRLLSYLRLISSDEDDLAWRSLIFHSQGLGAQSARKIYDHAVREGIRFHQSLVYCASNDEILPRRARSLLQTLVREVEQIIAEFAPILEDSGKEDAPTLTTEELIAPVRKLAERIIADDQNRASVVGFLSQVAEISSASNLTILLTSLATKSEDLEKEPETGKINIMTMHSAKGLSADVVFVMAAEDQSLPRKEDQASIDDDRRLLYVSLTRARHSLFVSYCGARHGLQAHSGRATPNGARTLTRFLRYLHWPITPGVNFSRRLARDVDLTFVQAEAGSERDSQQTL